MKSSFQTIILVIFIAAFAAAILIFSGIIKVGSSSSSEEVTGSVVIWGVYPADSIQPYIDNLNITNNNIVITYVQKNPDTLSQELTAALADAVQPDIVISNSEEFFSIRNRTYVFPFESYPERTFRDTYVDGASLFLSPEGVLALPLLVDPLVVYYNKDLLAGQNYVVPPTTWSGLTQSISRFVKRDSRGVITQTALPLGEQSNITNFKEILSLLFLQTGNPITTLDQTTNRYQSVLIPFDGLEEVPPTLQALLFFTNFSNPTNTLFSWTRTLPSDLDMFLSGRSAFYIGKASELFTIQSRNPNLNFDVTSMFQPDEVVRPTTYGSFSSVAIVRTTRNFQAAYIVAGQLSSQDFVSFISGALSLPPAQRSLLLLQQRNPYVQVFFNAALASFSWVDTNPQATDGIFRAMIQAVSSGRVSAAEALYEASRDLQFSIR